MTQIPESSNVPATIQPATLSPYTSLAAFEAAQRMAKQLAASGMVPETYRDTHDKGLSNCVLALELAHRIGVSPFVVMQNCHMISGKPSWSATFLIGLINGSGRFKDGLHFDITGEGDDLGCVAWAETHTGERKESDRITVAMAKAEGWWNRPDKKGRNTSKWPNMTRQMLCYRAASFFSRLHMPEATLGLHTADEVEDFTTVETTATEVPPPADPPAVEPLISEGQRRRLYPLCKERGVSMDAVKEHFGFASANDIPKARYDEVCAWIDQNGTEPGAEG